MSQFRLAPARAEGSKQLRDGTVGFDFPTSCVAQWGHSSLLNFHTIISKVGCNEPHLRVAMRWHERNLRAFLSARGTSAIIPAPQ